MPVPGTATGHRRKNTLALAATFFLLGGASILGLSFLASRNTEKGKQESAHYDEKERIGVELVMANNRMRAVMRETEFWSKKTDRVVPDLRQEGDRLEKRCLDLLKQVEKRWGKPPYSKPLFPKQLGESSKNLERETDALLSLTLEGSHQLLKLDCTNVRAQIIADVPLKLPERKFFDIGTSVGRFEQMQADQRYEAEKKVAIANRSLEIEKRYADQLPRIIDKWSMNAHQDLDKGISALEVLFNLK
jgi:hypothetical protein